MTDVTLMWTVFFCIVSLLLYIDLGVLNKNTHAVTLKEAAYWCSGWVSVALIFGALINWKLGHEKALSYLTGYVIEYSLSVDNMFVFVLVFSYFGVAPQYQPRILHWGILGAVIMRFILIFAGVSLINSFHWIIYVFGVVLIYTAVKMATEDCEKMDPGKNPVLKLFKKFLPFRDTNEGDSFFVRDGIRWVATPLFATLIVIEASDLVFAVDSIPAVLAISRDSFVVYTSNIFAILGLRSLYFLLAGIMNIFRYLKYGISVILFFVGVKMLISGFYHISTGISLSVVVGVLALSIIASLIVKPAASC